MELTDEQKRRIEANRQAALAKLAGSKRPLSDPPLQVAQVDNVPQEPQVPIKLPPVQRPKLYEQTTSKVMNTDKNAVIKSRLESPGMINIFEGGQSSMFVGVPGAFYSDGGWHVPLCRYRDVVKGRTLGGPADVVPENVIDTLLSIQAAKASGNSKEPSFTLNGSIPEPLLKALFPFQVDGVQWGLSKNGRIILADDMGLGKSLQALAIAHYYRREWPLLILAPASMVATWTEQVKKWILRSGSFDADYDNIDEMDDTVLSVAYDGKAVLKGVVNVVSYDLAVRLIDNIETLDPKVVIADESHCLRNSTTKRFKTLGPFLKKVSRLILLSGTPALSRPIELYSQLSLVIPKLFTRQIDYGLRYCAGRKDRFGWNFRGASNLRELGIILEQTIMLRRSKSQVLTQLPRKIRQQVFIRVPEKDLKELRQLADSISTGQWASLNGLEEAQKMGELMALWRRTGECKLQAMWAYIVDLLDTGDSIADNDGQDGSPVRKVLLFAHHQTLMDELENKLRAEGLGYIRIDGRTPPSNRHSLCTSFQTDRKIRVAILSITAASVGLTLTAATLVIFCELFFNPGILIQAEDRAHRIGQTDSVTVHYLLAKGTIDDRLWPLLLSKLNTLETVGLGSNDFTGMTHIEHDHQQMRIDRFLAPHKSS